ncbi:MAG: HAMP domain-containing histidine kinase [Leptolyngbyaceae cyanobacterium RM1_406_9]|nr:HAMP domain-containing histidine kinase [Leptolyngbyaceae cyanobacterium RM1_406_9]
MRWSIEASQQLRAISAGWGWLKSRAKMFLIRFKSHPESTDYLIWRQQFFLKRLRLGLRLGTFWSLIGAITGIYYALVDIEELRANFLKFFGDASIADALRDAVIIYNLVVLALLVLCLIGWRTAWGKRHPALLFLVFTCSLNEFLGQVVTTFFHIPLTPDTLIFLAIAILIPVRWRLHLIAQALPIVYYAIVYPIIGLTTLGTTDTFKLYTANTIVEIAWVCSVSILAVYLYEQLKRSEFEAHRQLQVFLYSVSHDLQTPVVGTSIVLKSLLSQPVDGCNDEIRVKRSVIERLLQGSDRQLTLINSLIESHTTEVQGIVIYREPIQLKPLVDSVLIDLQHSLAKKRVQLTNHITSELPLVNADANQLWRVFSNLIGNALKHNPHGIELTLDATVLEPRQGGEGVKRWRGGRVRKIKPTHQCSNIPMLLCIVQDNGTGIAPEQCQRLFKLYTRGNRARYMPGLGLGLYLCQQIIVAHSGEIGVDSHLGKGSTFWFTLPLYPT